MSDRITPGSKREEFEAVVAALNARDFERLAQLLPADLEFRSTLATAEGEVYRGIDGLRKWASNVDAVWERFELEVVDFREVDDDQAVVDTRSFGQARESGVPLEAHRGAVLTWRDGKPWRAVVYADPRDALEAAGLQE